MTNNDTGKAGETVDSEQQLQAGDDRSKEVSELKDQVSKLTVRVGELEDRLAVAFASLSRLSSLLRNPEADAGQPDSGAA